MQVTTNRIELIAESGADAILNLLKGRKVGHVVNARQERVHQHVERLGAKVAGSNHELRHVRANRVPRESAAEQEIWRHLTAAVSRTAVAWQGVQFCRCLYGSGVSGVIGEGHIV